MLGGMQRFLESQIKKMDETFHLEEDDEHREQEEQSVEIVVEDDGEDAHHIAPAPPMEVHDVTDKDQEAGPSTATPRTVIDISDDDDDDEETEEDTRRRIRQEIDAVLQAQAVEEIHEELL